MKTPYTVRKFILLIIPLLFISFTIGDSKSEYTVPRAAYSINTGDIDFDGDIDIVVGHNYNSQTEWSGVSFLVNNGNGSFILYDSIFLYSWQTHIYAVNTDADSLPEIIARHYENETQYMAILDFEQGGYTSNLNSMNYGISGNNIGDINGDSFKDIILYSNDNQFWGIMYNDGTGNFSSPWYYNVQDYNPSDITCADLNDDGRDDIVVGGKTEIFFSYESGFQSLFFNTNTYHIETVDFDNDGDIDIIGAHQPMPTNYYLVTLIENLGDENFTVHPDFIFQPVCKGGLTIIDFNNDSLPELLFQTQDMQNLLIFYNKGDFEIGDSVFIPMVDYGETTRKSACADFDGNGFIDIATIRYLHSPIINLNILFNDGNGNFLENPITNIQTSNFDHQTSNLTCYPNPFRTETKITFTSRINENIQLQIFDIQGNHIIALLNEEIQPGEYTVKWNGTDKNNKEVNPGIYFLILFENGNRVKTLKLLKQ